MAEEYSETPQTTKHERVPAQRDETPQRSPIKEPESRRGQQREPQRRRGGGRFYPRFSRRKVCVFCQQKIEYIDYKDVSRLRKFMTDRGKIIPRRISGTCAHHQRVLTRAIKRARIIALVPFKGE